MKQKIVIRVTLDCQKCGSKALSIAAKAKGVSSLSLEGEERDQLVVIGDRVDSVCLTRTLRKRFCHASILSVQEMKEEKKEEEKKEEGDKSHSIPQYPPCPCPSSYYVVYDSHPDGFCSIL